MIVSGRRGDLLVPPALRLLHAVFKEAPPIEEDLEVVLDCNFRLIQEVIAQEVMRFFVNDWTVT